MDAPVSNSIIEPGGTAIKLEATFDSNGVFWGESGGFPPPPDVWKELAELKRLVQKQATQLEEHSEMIKALWISPGMPGYHEAVKEYHRKRCELKN